MARPVNTPFNTNKSFEFGGSSNTGFKPSSADNGTEDRISKLFQDDNIKLGLAAASNGQPFGFNALH